MKYLYLLLEPTGTILLDLVVFNIELNGWMDRKYYFR